MTTLDSIASPDIYTGWYQLLHRVLLKGEPASPRETPTVELLGVSLRVDNGLANIIVHPIRNLNYRFMVAEALWILEGCDNLAVIAEYNQKMRKYSDDGVKLSGAYGPRLMPQVPWLLAKLRDEETRQAVATIWTPTPPPSRDQCCTVCVQFIRRKGQLNLIVTMRSSDLWLGLPYDFFTFSTILNTMAYQLGCVVGWIQFNLGSSHLYMHDLIEARKVLTSPNLGYSLISPLFSEEIPDYLFHILHHPRSQDFPGDTIWNKYAMILTSRREHALAILAGVPAD